MPTIFYETIVDSRKPCRKNISGCKLHLYHTLFAFAALLSNGSIYARLIIPDIRILRICMKFMQSSCFTSLASIANNSSSKTFVFEVLDSTNPKRFYLFTLSKENSKTNEQTKLEEQFYYWDDQISSSNTIKKRQ